MSMLKTKQPTYKDGRTKQSFKDETDINKILQRAQVSGTVSHLTKYEARYGDFAGYDFFENQLVLAKGREVFDALPSEIRAEFDQSPAGFFKYVNDPNNKDRLKNLLPGLAEPGRQNINPSSLVKADDPPSAVADDQRLPEPQPPGADNNPPVAPNASTQPPAS